MDTKNREAVESQEMTPEQIEEQKKGLVKMFKSQTVFYKAQADYEESLTRIAVARRDRAIAEYEFAKIMAEQRRAEEEYQKSLENKSVEKTEEKKAE